MGQETTKILVVDDDMRLRSLLERYLVEQGYQVRAAANSEQMDRLLERENFHLMVLDLMLPGEDGLSICRRLRQKERSPLSALKLRSLPPNGTILPASSLLRLLLLMCHMPKSRPCYRNPCRRKFGSVSRLCLYTCPTAWITCHT